MAKALNLPIENLPDVNEQIALALIAHLAPALGPWRDGEDLREERGLLEKREPQADADLSAIRSTIQNFEQRLTQVIKSGDVLGLLIGGAAAFVIAFFTSYALIAVGLAAVGFGIFRIQQAKGVLQNGKATAERSLAKAADELNKIKQRLAAIDKELHARDGGFPEIEVARVGFPFRKVSVVGLDTIVDMSAIAPQVELSTVDLSKVGTRLQSVSADAKSLSVVPILLAPKSEMRGSQAVERLYGEEDRLRELVNGFVETLSAIDDIKIRLPLVPASGEIARRMTERTLTDVPDQSIVLLQTEVTDVNRIGGFVAQVNSAKTIGERVLADLRSTYQSLAMACDAYSSARLSSINHLHQQLFDVLNRSSWCSKRFYCPRTIQSPEYIQSLLQVEIESAHELAFEDLAQRLETDPLIARRIKERTKVMESLKSAHNSLRRFSPISRENVGMPSIAAEKQAPYIQDQYNELLKQFRISLFTVISGTDYPVLTFSTEAQMFYDPTADEWRSDVVQYTYSTADMQRFGQVLKVHSDVLFPLWEHLWTEKADFRKSELFRTNESMSRMGEKESEKLIEIGNQYRADMRPVRENIYLVESELKAKGDELRQFRDAMKDLGVLSERQMRHLSNDYLKRLTLGDGSALEEAEQNEILLASEPQSQAERRGSVHDPIDIARAPDILIGYSIDSVHPPRLPMPGGSNE